MVNVSDSVGKPWNSDSRELGVDVVDRGSELWDDNSGVDFSI